MRTQYGYDNARLGFDSSVQWLGEVGSDDREEHVYGENIAKDNGVYGSRSEVGWHEIESTLVDEIKEDSLFHKNNKKKTGRTWYTYRITCMCSIVFTTKKKKLSTLC